MSIKIAELYAVISADASKLHTELNKTKSGLTGLKSDITSAMATVGAITGAFVAAGVAVKKLADEYVLYVDQVSNMSRITGMGVEQTSRLIQAADDMFISQQTLQSGMEFAIRKGYQPSVEWLGQMADKIMSIEDPAARTKEAIAVFGRAAGPEMMKMMEQGASGIRSMTAAISGGLVVTEQARQKAYNYKVQMDNLDDSVTGLKYEFANGLLPAITTTTDFIVNKSIPGWKEFIIWFGHVYEKSHLVRNTFDWFTLGFPKWLQGAMDTSKGAESLAVSLDKVNESVTDLGTTIDTQLDFETAFSGLYNVQDKAQLTVDTIGGMIRGLGVEGSLVWEGFLSATGKISPAAAEQFVKMLDMYQHVKDMIEGGIVARVGIQPVVDYITHQTAEINSASSPSLTPAQQAENAWRIANGYKPKSFAPGNAGGGMLGKEGAFVGDMPGGGMTPWTEYIDGSGRIYSAEETRALINAGVISVAGGKHYAIGNAEMLVDRASGGITRAPTKSDLSNYDPYSYQQSHTTSKGSYADYLNVAGGLQASVSSSSSAQMTQVVTSAVEATQAAIETTGATAASVKEAAATISVSGAETARQTQLQTSMQTVQNQLTIAELREIKNLLQRNFQEMPRMWASAAYRAQ